MTADLRVTSDLRNIVANIGGLGKAHIYNANRNLMQNYRLQLARALVGSRRLRIACIGDSLTVGAGAGSGTAELTGAKAKSYPAYLAKLFRQAGFVVSEDSVWGDNRVFDPGLAAVTLYDPKVTFEGSGWTRSTTMGLGGQVFYNASTSDKLTFTPAEAGTNIDVYYLRGSSNASFTVSDGASVLNTINASGSNGFLKASLTRSSSANAINIARSTAGNLYIGGIDQWADDTQISIYNCGAYGTTTADWAFGTQPFHARLAQSTLAPDVAIINLGTNDQRQSRTAAAFKADLQACITAWGANLTTIFLAIPQEDGNYEGSAGTLDYITAAYELAFENNLPLVDLNARFGSRAESEAEYSPGSAVHLLAEGYADVAMAVWELLRPQ